MIFWKKKFYSIKLNISPSFAVYVFLCYFCRASVDSKHCSNSLNQKIADWNDASSKTKSAQAEAYIWFLHALLIFLNIDTVEMKSNRQNCVSTFHMSRCTEMCPESEKQTNNGPLGFEPSQMSQVNCDLHYIVIKPPALSCAQEGVIKKCRLYDLGFEFLNWHSFIYLHVLYQNKCSNVICSAV